VAASALALPAGAQAASLGSGSFEAAVSSAGSHTLLGLTSQFACEMETSPVCGTVQVQLASGAQRVKRVTIGYETACGAPNMYYSGLVTASQFRGPGPRFAKVGQLREDLGDGRTGVADVTLKGKLNPKRRVASGRFHVVVRIYDPGVEAQGGPPLDTCDSGTITWKVSRVTR
jgi:hypothetical protein